MRLLISICVYARSEAKCLDIGGVWIIIVWIMEVTLYAVILFAMNSKEPHRRCLWSHSNNIHKLSRVQKVMSFASWEVNKNAVGVMTVCEYVHAG